jgi:polygalacturonase
LEFSSEGVVEMRRCNICDFGARGDGITVNTEFIQQAIDCCHERGGGDVWVPAGTFLSGSVFLRSNVRLYLETGSKLIASLDRNDIRVDSDFQVSTTGFLIGAIAAENIGIAGSGIIDGQGDSLMEPDDGISEYPLLPGEERTKLCYLRGCRNVKIQEVTFQNASQWTIHLIGCRHVQIRGINIFNNLRGANNDGIDPDSCRDVRISDCYIEGGDDAIVIKTTRKAAEVYGDCEDITVTGCQLISRGSALKIGTETHAAIRNCLFSHCIVKNSNRGLGIWVRDGGTVENVIVSDLIVATRIFQGAPHRDTVRDWWGKGEPVFISAGFRTDGVNPGKIRKIIIRALLAEAENSLFIKGVPESVIEDVTLDNVHLTIRRSSGHPGGVFDEQPPEGRVYAHHTPAIFARHVRNLTITHTRIQWGADHSGNWSNAICGEALANLQISHLTACPARDGMPVIGLRQVTNLTLSHCLTPGKALLIKGEDVNGMEHFPPGGDPGDSCEPIDS